MSASDTNLGKTLDQQRASHAWKTVSQAKNQMYEKFVGQAKKLPVRVMASGLGQAMAFLKAKNDAPGLVAALSDWVASRLPPRPGEPRDLLDRIIHGNSDFLRRATDEVLAYLQWLNRFAEAEGLTEGGNE